MRTATNSAAAIGTPCAVRNVEVEGAFDDADVHSRTISMSETGGDPAAGPEPQHRQIDNLEHEEDGRRGHGGAPEQSDEIAAAKKRECAAAQIPAGGVRRAPASRDEP